MFPLICVTSILTTIYSLKTVQFMKDLAVFTALNHSSYLGMNFVKFKKKKNVICRPLAGIYYIFY